jgi:hypothetical protein
MTVVLGAGRDRGRAPRPAAVKARVAALALGGARDFRVKYPGPVQAEAGAVIMASESWQLTPLRPGPTRTGSDRVTRQVGPADSPATQPLLSRYSAPVPGPGVQVRSGAGRRRHGPTPSPSQTRPESAV